MTAPIIRLNTIGKLRDLLELSSFDSPKMEWLRKSASADQIFDLYNFIQEEQESEEVMAFAKGVIASLTKGGEMLSLQPFLNIHLIVIMKIYIQN